MVLGLIAAATLGWFILDRSWIRGNGIIAGELTAESPIVQARLERLLVKCLDHVSKGQRLAEFSNEAMVELAGQEVQQLQFQLAQAQAEVEIADREAEAAQKLTDAQNALLQQQVAVLQAESKLKEQNFVADLVWQQAKAAVDRADAETRAAEFVYQTKRADQRMAQVSVDVLQKRIDSYVNSPELTGHFYLTAAKDGIVTECTAREGEVIAARTPILSIFNPKDTYAVVFFDPSDRNRLFRGQNFDLRVQGMPDGVSATLTDFYPSSQLSPARSPASSGRRRCGRNMFRPGSISPISSRSNRAGFSPGRKFQLRVRRIGERRILPSCLRAGGAGCGGFSGFLSRMTPVLPTVKRRNDRERPPRRASR